MKVFWSDYELTPKSFNSSSNSCLTSKISAENIRGGLIRVKFEKEITGYASVHSWPSLGDPSLKQLKTDLMGLRKEPIVQQALVCAQEDAKAREKKVSLLHGLEVPKSHFLMTSLEADLVSYAQKNKFQTIKLKIGKEKNKELHWLNDCFKEWPNLNWRLDPNASFSCSEFVDFWHGIKAKENIEFVEDPCSYTPDDWKKLDRHKIPLALDIEVLNFLANPSDIQLKALVLKPEAQDIFDLSRRTQAESYVVTSYMAHPLGQVWSAVQAARLKKDINSLVAECGLLSHQVYEENQFSQHFSNSDSFFVMMKNSFGLGFTQELESLKWEEL